MPVAVVYLEGDAVASLLNRLVRALREVHAVPATALGLTLVAACDPGSSTESRATPEAVDHMYLGEMGVHRLLVDEGEQRLYLLASAILGPRCDHEELENPGPDDCWMRTELHVYDVSDPRDAAFIAKGHGGDGRAVGDELVVTPEHDYLYMRRQDGALGVVAIDSLASGPLTYVAGESYEVEFGDLGVPFSATGSVGGFTLGGGNGRILGRTALTVELFERREPAALARLGGLQVTDVEHCPSYLGNCEVWSLAAVRDLVFVPLWQGGLVQLRVSLAGDLTLDERIVEPGSARCGRVVVGDGLGDVLHVSAHDDDGWFVMTLVRETSRWASRGNARVCGHVDQLVLSADGTRLFASTSCGLEVFSFAESGAPKRLRIHEWEDLERASAVRPGIRLEPAVAAAVHGEQLFLGHAGAVLVYSVADL